MGIVELIPHRYQGSTVHPVLDGVALPLKVQGSQLGNAPGSSHDPGESDVGSGQDSFCLALADRLVVPIPEENVSGHLAFGLPEHVLHGTALENNLEISTGSECSSLSGSQLGLQH